MIVGRANQQLSVRLHKTVMVDWQKNILNYIKEFGRQNHVVDNQVELVEEFKVLQLNDIDFGRVGDVDFDPLFEIFFIII